MAESPSKASSSSTPVENGFLISENTPKNLIPNGNFKDDVESPIFRNRSKKRAIVSDSEEESPNLKIKHSRPSDESPIVNGSSPQDGDSGEEDDRVGSFLSNKELSLRSLKTKFPKLDLTFIQDTLSACHWNSDKAFHVLRDDCNVITCRHFLSNTVVPANEPPKAAFSSGLPPPFKKIQPLETSSKTLDTWLVKPVVEEVASAKLQRRKIHTMSSSSDDEDSQPTPKKENSSNSDKEDDDDGKNEEIGNGQVEVKKSPEVQSSIKRQKEHELSENDDENEDEEKDERKTDTHSGNNDLLNSLKSKFSRSKHKKKKKRKRRDVRGGESDDDDDYRKDTVYDSDDSDIDDAETPARLSVLSFYNDAVSTEVLSVAGLSKKKLDNVLKLRPFTSWVDLVTKFQNDRQLTTDLLNRAREVIQMREVMSKLMSHCGKFSKEMEKLFSKVKDNDMDSFLIKEQPSILNKEFKLAPYQMVGLNWLYLMHMKELNGILADEMGLGKTIQAIAFLGHLFQTGQKGPHLIVVPSSTIDNWVREVKTWCDSLSVICYRGSQMERKELRLQIINKEIEFHVMITTYNMVGSSAEDKTLFKRLLFNYVIFDEAHMLKNMATVRYRNLMGIKAHRRLCLTGTPLQNNLVELMSLLIFVMPTMFDGKIDHVRRMFTCTAKNEEARSAYESEQIDHAKQIMKPFVLRRLKADVLKQLPAKMEQIRSCPMSTNQKNLYEKLVTRLKPQVMKGKEREADETGQMGGIGMVVELRKAANHPLLRRCVYTDVKLRKIAKCLMKEPIYKDSNEQFIFEDLQVMSDFEIHKLCLPLKTVKQFILDDDQILDSGKFQALDEILAEWKEKGERVLLFSQFCIMLNIIEDYMKVRNHKYIRLDGSTPVGERQDLIDNFTADSEIFVFLLSTKAGGLGINLTAANVVVLHDIDYNPYNDKQAEDRCHRIGQTREVTIIRMISTGTIEEGMLHCAREKLKLEKNVTSSDNAEESKSVASNLLKSALGFS